MRQHRQFVDIGRVRRFAIDIDDPPEVENTPTRFWEIYGTMSIDGDDFTCEFLLP